MKSKYFLVILLWCTGLSCTKDGVQREASSGSGKGGSLAKFTIVGNYLYILRGSELDTYNIENPETPAFGSSVHIDWGVETLFPYNDKLFIGSQNGMFIYSLNDPATPALLGQAQHLRSCDPVVANDSVAFVTLRGNACGPATDGLYVYDVKDITKPTLVKTVEIPTPSGLGLNDSILYVCQQQHGLSVYNIENPGSPLLRREITDAYFEDVIVYYNILICYVNNGLRLYDISTPSNPVLLTSLEN
ncbi:MAG: hypothetical protein KF862_23160 [Chitinophagaceae bacterium]|nr:hypothetical protein [Chitinophagaceae bacterium]